MLFGVKHLLRLTARRSPSFKARLAEKNLTAQISARKNRVGRWYSFTGGGLVSKSGFHPDPDITILYHDAALGTRLMTPWRSQLEQISAMKSFKVDMQGPGELTSWFAETLSALVSTGFKCGLNMGEGVRRYVSGTNGGPVFVYVKDGKILRITPHGL